ncbi:MAG: N-glycosylase/DNA lyase [Candidatus Altiarchaeota archaeon]|nr:N-glycosylase/DNA lyase [Candidatus Altiarchaeota archaeon]
MGSLEKKIRELEKSPIKKQVEGQITLFENKRDWNELFSELCFCLLTANYTAEGGIRIQKKLGFEGFYNLAEDELAHQLIALGHRFPNARAAYIVQARKIAEDLPTVFRFDGKNARLWLQGVKGLGMKEASHFLRNVGFKDVAIIDRHILRGLKEHDYILQIPKTITRKQYIEIEKIVEELGKGLEMDLARLDLYMWYLKTGKILK